MFSRYTIYVIRLRYKKRIRRFIRCRAPAFKKTSGWQTSEQESIKNTKQKPDRRSDRQSQEIQAQQCIQSPKSVEYGGYIQLLCACLCRLSSWQSTFDGGMYCAVLRAAVIYFTRLVQQLRLSCLSLQLCLCPDLVNHKRRRKSLILYHQL